MSFGFDQEVSVTRVVSQLEGGAIFLAATTTGETVRIKYQGRGLTPLPGDSFHVKGQWGTYTDKFRKAHKQVATKVMQRRIPIGELLTPWLQRLPNIGPERVKRLLDRFGPDLVAVLKDSTRIAEVAATIEPRKPALASRVAAQLYAAMAEKSAADQLRVAEAEFLAYLEKLGLQEPRIAFRLWRLMAGPNATERLFKNPYVPAHLMEWTIADRVGKQLLRECADAKYLDTHPARLLGGLASVWRELISNGDSAAPEERVRAMLSMRGVDPDLALALATSRQQLCRSETLLRAPGAAWLEDEVTRAIARIEATPPTFAMPEKAALDRCIDAGENATDLHLTMEQRNAIRRLLQQPVSILQGGAGVGKTTVMKVLAYCWERLGGNIVMGALAGKAALQLSRGASSHSHPRLAYTLARLIGMLEDQAAGGTDRPGRQPEVVFDNRTLLIIDEAGMMDTPTLHRILALLPIGAHLLLAGDDGQLFPIGFGKVFHDLVAEGSRVANLTKVLRQAEDSAIPLVAGQIRSGITPELQGWKGEAKGVFLVSPEQREEVQRKVQPEDFLLVAARRDTVATINDTEANARRTVGTLARRLGPLATVAEGDPVVITANRYSDGLFNGLLGVVTDVSGARVQIHFDGEAEPRELPEEAEGDVELAYAITCHKAQGSSANVVMVIVEDSALVTREWLYTALTRSKTLALLVAANSDDLAKATARRTTRTTGMRIEKAKRNQDSVE